MFFVDYYNLRFLLPLLRVPPHSESPPPHPMLRNSHLLIATPLLDIVSNSINDYNNILIIIVVNSHLANICYVISYMYFQSTP